LDGEGLAITDEFPTVLRPGDRVAIENPWHQGEDRFLPCLVRGTDKQVVLEVGQSVGSVVFKEGRWLCVGLVHQGALAKSMVELELSPPEGGNGSEGAPDLPPPSPRVKGKTKGKTRGKTKGKTRGKTK
jgi:hypothetical protein